MRSFIEIVLMVCATVLVFGSIAALVEWIWLSFGFLFGLVAFVLLVSLSAWVSEQVAEYRN